MAALKPFNLLQWIEQNRHLLVPPVGNKNIYVDSGDYIVMVVAGPNARKDYHYNETEELFYQLKGDFTVYIQEDGQKKTDGLLWFCENCNTKLHEAYFELYDIEKDFLPHFNQFYASQEMRTCKQCGTIIEINQ